MPSYLRVTPTHSRNVRETTTDPVPTRLPGNLVSVEKSWNGTDRARRAGLSCVRWGSRPGEARATIASGDARAVHVGGEGERPRAHARAVGQRARGRRRPHEELGREPAAHRPPDLSEPRRLPRHRGPAPRAQQARPPRVPRGAAALDVVHGRRADRGRAHEGRSLARGRHRSREYPEPGVAVQELTSRELGEPVPGFYSVSSTKMPAVVFGCTNAMRWPPAPRRGTSSTRRYPAARQRSSARSRSGTRYQTCSLAA